MTAFRGGKGSPCTWVPLGVVLCGEIIGNICDIRWCHPKVRIIYTSSSHVSLKADLVPDCVTEMGNGYHCVNPTSGCFQDSESHFLHSTRDRNVWSSPASHDLSYQWPWPKHSPLFKELFSFFLAVQLTNKECSSGGLKTWTVNMTDAIGEGCLGRSVPSLEAGPAVIFYRSL